MCGQKLKLLFKIIIPFLFIFFNIYSLYSEKYYLNKSWLYKKESDATNIEWGDFKINESLIRQNINLKKGESIYYKYIFNLESLSNNININEKLGIFFGKIEGVTEIYINSNKLYTSLYFDKIIFFELNKEILNKNNEIKLKVTKDNNTFSSKIDIVPYIDRYENIYNYFMFVYIIQIIIGICFILIGIFYLFYFNRKLENYEYLYFFFLCLISFIYTLLKSPLKFYLIDTLDISFLLCKKIEFFIIYITPITGLFFFDKIYGESGKFIKNIIKIISLSILLLLIAVIFLNFEIMRYTLFLFFSLLFICFILFFYLLIKTMIKRKVDTIIILIGLIIFFSFCILDVTGIYHVIKIYDKFPFFIIGSFIFIYSIGIYQSRQFLHTNLTLKELTYNLEQKVIERTQQLEEKEKQKTIAFTNISHEIKTPLTIISNYIEKHIRNHGENEEIKIARDNINKLKRDIIDVLDFEKLEAGMVFYDHSQIVDVSNVIRMNILMFKELADQKGINIKHDIKKNVYTKIDINAMDRIINNLIDNAIKYTPINGEIKIILKNEKKVIELIIQDTGIGISKEEQENIFKPYFQISHKKSNIQGIGMGLNITKKIIDEIEGKIEVDSKLNEGAKFTVKFKKHILAGKDIIQKRTEHSILIDNITNIKLREEKYIEGKNNVYIVEDNIQMLSYLQENLFDKYNVFYARDGKDALEKLRNIPKPDIIIADIMMDVMDGYEFYDNIKKSENFNDIPFLILTAKSGLNEKIKALSMGAIDFISKPFDLNELLFKLNSILEVNKKHEKKFIESIYKVSKEQLKEIDNEIEAVDFDKIKEKYNLTNNEIEICKLIKERLTNKEIGLGLNKAESTIKNYIQIIFEKLLVNKREKAIELMDEFKLRKF